MGRLPSRRLERNPFLDAAGALRGYARHAVEAATWRLLVLDVDARGWPAIATVALLAAVLLHWWLQ